MPRKPDYLVDNAEAKSYLCSSDKHHSKLQYLLVIFLSSVSLTGSSDESPVSNPDDPVE